MSQIKNTAKLSLDGKMLKRKFLGNLFPETTFEKNELKAYIKGHSRFAYKKDEWGNQLFYPVRQEYYYEKLELKN